MVCFLFKFAVKKYSINNNNNNNNGFYLFIHVKMKRTIVNINWISRLIISIILY